MYVLALGLLAIPVWLLAHRDAWMLQSEGSPAGTILVSIVGTVGLSAIVAGVACAIGGAMALAIGAGWGGFARGVASLCVVILVPAATGWHFIKPASGSKVRVKGAPAASQGEAPAVETGSDALAELRSGLAPDLLARPAAADRALYDECAAQLRDGAASRRFKTCADGLVEAWDKSHAARKAFANMPDDGGGFPARVGAMYVAYAEADGDARTALAGVKAVLARARARYPGDEATLVKLGEQEATLARAAR